MSTVPLSVHTVSANSIDAAYQRSLPLVRVIFIFFSASCWLILGSHVLELSFLETLNWIPVLVVALASSIVTLSLKVYQDSAILPRILPAALAIPLLSIAVGYQNGYLPATFAPLVMLLSMAVYRGRGCQYLPYLIWTSWALAIYLSPAQEGREYSARLLVITLLLIPMIEPVLSQEKWDMQIKAETLQRGLFLATCIALGFAFENLVTGGNPFPSFLGAAIFFSNYQALRFQKLRSLYALVTISGLVFATYWYFIYQNGTLPLALIAGYFLFSFLLLPAFEATFFSLGLVVLSLLPLIGLDADQLGFEPVPFFTRLFAISLMLIFALYYLFRSREKEAGLYLEAAPLGRGMLAATCSVLVLAAVENQRIVEAFESGSSGVLGTMLINGLLVWLLATWLSSVYLRNQRTLKRTVKNLTAAENSLQKQLEQQRQLFAVISHEIRTPAASLSMLLHDQPGKGKSPSEQNRLIEIADHLVEVLNDLRQVVQPSQLKQSEAQATNLFELVERSANALSVMLGQRQQHLSISTKGELSQSVLVHRQGIRQILTNLIKNASVHSGASEIEIQIETQLQADVASLAISVCDNGRGLGDELQKRMFEAFARGDTDADGTGLGLYICKELADQMGGQLVYSPRNGGGSRFTLELTVPVVEQTPRERAQPEPQDCRIKGKRVLLAEDNKTIQLITAKMLEQIGATMVLAENGEEALRLFEQTPDAFDIILTDIMMPKMDGYELTRKLRAANCMLPIVGITAATIGEERERLLDQGATSVISKPINLESLRAAIV